MPTYPGNIHIHTQYSDGSRSIPEIAEAADDAGLRFIIITDHMTLAGLEEEGWHGKVAVLAGMEINRGKNHYLAFGLSEPVLSDENNPQNVIDAVRCAGASGYLAHPFERGSKYIENGIAYPWVDWPVFGFTGIEIWNYTSHWRGLRTSFPGLLFRFFGWRKHTLEGPPPELLMLWDCYNRQGHRVYAIGGSDAHAFVYRKLVWPITIFPYPYLFRTINTYITVKRELPSEFQLAKKEILNALANGRCFIAYDLLGKAHEFSFCAANKAGEELVSIGEQVGLCEQPLLQVRLPESRRTLIRLLADGKVVCEKKGNYLEHIPVCQGTYRVEVLKKSLTGRFYPWIYSNPIFVGQLQPKVG